MDKPQIFWYNRMRSEVDAMLPTIREFMKITENVDRNKYHICCSITSDLCHCEWTIFRKDMPLEEYWSENNRPILSSKTNSFEDLVKFCEEC